MTDRRPPKRSRPGTLTLLGKRPAAPSAPKSDPGAAFSREAPTEPFGSKEHRAARLVAHWNNLTPDNQKLASQVIAALQSAQPEKKP